MKYVYVRICLIISLVGVLVSCAGDKPSFSLLSEDDEFRQSPDFINNDIDVLFVVDNSGSMSDDQTNLVNNFSTFIQEFSGKGYDFHIGVTATDAWRSTLGGGATMARLKDGTTTRSGIYVIDPSTPDIPGTFMIPGISGVLGSIT